MAEKKQLTVEVQSKSFSQDTIVVTPEACSRVSCLQEKQPSRTTDCEAKCHRTEKMGENGGSYSAGNDVTAAPEYVKLCWTKRYGPSLKKALPVRCEPSEDRQMPIHRSGMLSLFTFHWITPFMWSTYRKGFLDSDALWTCPDQESTEVNGTRFARLWEEEVKRKEMSNASLGWVMFRFLRTMLLAATLCNLLSVTFSFLGPAVLFRFLLDYAKSSEIDLTYGLTLVFALFLSEMGRTLSLMTQMLFGYLMGARIRSAVMYLIFNKILKLRSMKDRSVGEVVNFFANDCQRFLDLATFSPLVLSGPLTAIAGTIYCVYYIGPWALLGAAVIALYYPYQAIISKFTTYVRRKTITVTDTRVRMISEILTSIKLIKLYAWEKSFSKTIAAIRAKEKRFLQHAAYLQTMSISINPMVPVFASVCTFIGHILAGNELTSSQAFVVVAVYNLTRVKVSVLPRLVRVWSETQVGLRRAKSFLVMEEIDYAKRLQRPTNSASALEMVSSTFAWDTIHPETVKRPGRRRDAKKEKETRRKESDRKLVERKLSKPIANGVHKTEVVPMKQVGNQDEYVEVLFDVNLTIPKGCLCGICGRIGSGKSSLISAMLGQMHQRSGSIAADGTFCYVPQQAWIRNATIRENILFGLPYDRERYEEVVKQCHLTYDLKQLSAGDRTEIGERGINLSGGQKQRVSLARAMYSDRDIYLLDDALSAVDPQVGSHLFENCLVRCTANGKTVIFVTHQMQYLSKCDKILLLKDGHILEHGTHDSLMASNGEYANIINTYYSDDGKETRTSEKDDIKGDRNANFKGSVSSLDSLAASQTSLHRLSDGKLVEEEVKERGAVGWSTYRAYFKAAGGFCLSGMAIMSFALPVMCSSFSNWWLSFWFTQKNQLDYNSTVEQNSSNVTASASGDQIGSNPDTHFYLLIYGLSSVGVVVTLCIRGFLFTTVTLKASSNIHDMAFSRLLRSPMSYFDVTPVGRMLNRFSKDLDEIDVRLPFNAEELIQNVCLVLSAITMLCFVFPWYLIAAIPLAAIFWFVQTIARSVVREVKRVDNVTRSPIFSLISTSVQGIHTIHAYEKEKEFLDRFKEYLDKNTAAVMHFFFVTRWLTVRLDLLTIFTITFTALLIVLTKGLTPPSYAGLALVYAAQLTGLFQYTIRLITETESRFTSVERMQYYLQHVEEEAPWIVPECRPRAEWPQKGRITYVDYAMRYRKRLPLVLEGINCNIKASENIGVVGRTGSGKSSFVSAIFRLVEPDSGKIFIDDIDVSTIGLLDLRSKLSIIPQDPLLFVGTIRYNLDPFHEHDDVALWTALDRCHMKETVKILPGHLDSNVVENGENFSVGERQLFCLARALLRKSKILVLDEATAAVDTEMDALIQTTIANAFTGCTILTIAHRLHTVLHCDRIMVLDKGRIVEFDSPDVLLKNPSSKFYQMVHG